MIYSCPIQPSCTMIMYSHHVQSSCTPIMYSPGTLSLCMVHVYESRQIWRHRYACSRDWQDCHCVELSTKSTSSAGDSKTRQVPCEHAASTTHLFAQELTVLEELNKGIKVSGSSVGVELQGCHHLGAQVGPVDGFKHLCHCQVVVVQP